MKFVDDGTSSSGKKVKKGFKADREARYMERHKREMAALQGKKIKVAKVEDRKTRVKEVKFDPKGRDEYLTGMHKRKNERRVTAMVQARRKIKRENSKFRRETREEARKQFNRYAKVPILPDYSFQFPGEGEEGEEVEEEEGSDLSSAGEDSDVDYGSDDEVLDDIDAAAEQRRLQRDDLTGVTQHESGDYESVEVSVEPLFGGDSVPGKKKPAAAPKQQKKFVRGGMDFSDLDPTVASALEALKKKKKGPAQEKAKVHIVKEMQKYHKIMKHSRKKK